jgi:hypothetical protein
MHNSVRATARAREASSTPRTTCKRFIHFNLAGFFLSLTLEVTLRPGWSNHLTPVRYFAK